MASRGRGSDAAALVRRYPYRRPLTRKARTDTGWDLDARTLGRAAAGRAALGAEPAVPSRVGAQRPEEVDPSEVGAVRLAEVQLGVRGLPQQEAGQPLFAGRSDHQIGIGLTLGVEVLGDVFDVEDLGQLLDGRTPTCVVMEQRADRVGNLLPAAIADRDVDQHAGTVRGGRVGLLDHPRGLRWE